jgi:hypothetical protein
MKLVLKNAVILLLLTFGLSGAANAWPYGAFLITAGENGSYHTATAAEKAGDSQAQAACSGAKADQLSEWNVTYQQESDSYKVSAEFLCSDASTQ